MNNITEEQEDEYNSYGYEASGHFHGKNSEIDYGEMDNWKHLEQSPHEEHKISITQRGPPSASSYRAFTNNGDSFHSCCSSGFTDFNEQIIQHHKSELPQYMRTQEFLNLKANIGFQVNIKQGYCSFFNSYQDYYSPGETIKGSLIVDIYDQQQFQSCLSQSCPQIKLSHADVQIQLLAYYEVHDSIKNKIQILQEPKSALKTPSPSFQQQLTQALTKKVSILYQNKVGKLSFVDDLVIPMHYNYEIPLQLDCLPSFLYRDKDQIIVEVTYYLVCNLLCENCTSKNVLEEVHMTQKVVKIIHPCEKKVRFSSIHKNSKGAVPPLLNQVEKGEQSPQTNQSTPQFNQRGSSYHSKMGLSFQEEAARFENPNVIQDSVADKVKGYFAYLRTCCTHSLNTNKTKQLVHPESKTLNYKVLAKLNKKKSTSHLINVMVSIEVSPGEFTNQLNQNLRISLEKVTCTLIMQTNIKGGGQVYSYQKKLATLTEDISQEAQQNRNKGLYQVFMRSFSIDLNQIFASGNSSQSAEGNSSIHSLKSSRSQNKSNQPQYTCYTMKTDLVDQDFNIEVSLQFVNQEFKLLKNERKLSIPLYIPPPPQHSLKQMYKTHELLQHIYQIPIQSVSPMNSLSLN